MKPKLVYCQDALCGWCYGFGPVIERLAAEFSYRLDVEVFAGGMVRGDRVARFHEKAGQILAAIPRVEEMTGVKFGEAFLEKLRGPAAQNWRPDSEPPAIATVVFKSMMPERALEFASDLQKAANRDGLDLSDLDNYRPIVEKYGLDPAAFLEKMLDPDWLERAHYEFFICQQLEVTGFPTLFVQTDQLHFYLLTRGWAPFEAMKKKVEDVLTEWAARDN